MQLKIATRRSPLALWQAHHVADRLMALDAVDRVDLLEIVTQGDKILNVTLSKAGGKGLFIKELEQAMLDGKADIAVHSMKDVPAEPPPGFVFPAVLDREDPRDALVGASLTSLPAGAHVGTSSLRRHAQLKHLRPDLRISPIRGNVGTRLGKLDNGEYDATLLACAGLKRLGLENRIGEALSPDLMLPAAGQGIVGIECREDEPQIIDLLAQLNDVDSAQRIALEREVSRGLGADCHAPLGAFATRDQGLVVVTGVVASPDGTELVRVSHSASEGDHHELAVQVVADLEQQGARAILEAIPQ